MITVDPSVPVVQLIHALAYSGLGVREINGELRIVQTAAYRAEGHTSAGFVPACIRFEENDRADV